MAVLELAGVPPAMQKQIKALQKEFNKINKIDPDSSAYKRMILLLSLLPQSQLKIVANADIKFISSLALNRIKKPMVDKSAALAPLLALAAANKPFEYSPDMEEVAPAAVILASTVEKHRDGHEVTTYELASVVKRLAQSPLSSAEIADRFTNAFGDVLFNK